MPKVAVLRGWWWDHYHDHPSFQAGLPARGEGMAGAPTTGKHKVYCQKCFTVHIVTLLREDREAVALGLRANVRSQAQIEADLWALKSVTPNGHGWISSATTTVINHLRYCALVDQSIRDQAAEDHNLKLAPGSPTQQRRRREQDNAFAAGMAPPHTPSFYAGSPGGPSAIAGPSTPSSSTAPDYPYEWGGSDIPPSPSPHYPSFHHDSSTPAPSDSGSSLTGNSRALSRSNSRSGLQRGLTRHTSLPVIDPSLYWPAEKQKRFERRIARLTASAGFALSWVDNLEWIDFCSEFLPAAKLPSRKTLTRRLLPVAAAELRATARAAANGHEATLQADGWTGLNNHHLLAFMITTNGKIYTVKVADTSEERKTAEKLLDHLEIAMKEVQEKWGATVTAIVTDASGECRKARRILGQKYPWLIVLDCYSHQINLVVGQYFKSNAGVLKYADKATHLIMWLRSKTLVLAMIRKVRLAANLNPLAIIRAVLTRWTAHYMAYRRLLELRQSLESIVINDAMQSREEDKTIITGDAKAKRKSRRMIKIIQDALFWHALTRMKRHLEPLAIATNVTQASFCRLDQVLMAFGHLIMQYRSMVDTDDMEGCTVIMESIEARWAKADQEIFIAAVILNPFYQSTPFAEQQFLTNAGIHAMLNRLWLRFYQNEPPAELYEQVTDYLRGTGLFVDLKMCREGADVVASRESRTPDPVALYDDFCHPGRPPPAFIRLAKRILSVSANSASCERLFSVFGNLLTKLRNRLGTENMTMLAELKMHIRDEHSHAQTKKRLKRVFQVRTQAERAAAALAVSAAPASTVVDATVTTHVAPLQPPEPEASTWPESDTSDDDHDYGMSGGPSLHPTSSSQSSNSFRAMAEHQSQLLDEDDMDCAPIRRPSISLTPISALFDFNRAHWVEMYSRSSIRSFDDELEMYELLDLDAEGEEDADVDIDDDTGDVLMD